MKIAYISSYAYSDLDISMMEKAQQLLDIDYYILLGHSRAAAALDLRDIRLKNMLTCASEIDYFRRFENIMNLNRVFVFENAGNLIKTIWTNYKFYRFIRKKKYDIIHITTEPSYRNPFIYILRRRLLLTVHDPIRHSNNHNRIEEFNRKLAHRYIPNQILLNENQKSEFVRLYHVPQRTRIYTSFLSSYNYLTAYVRNGKQQPLDGIKPYILFFGAISSYKGLEYLFEAMQKVHETDPSLTLVAAGKGNYYFDINLYQKLDYIKIINRFIPDDELAVMISGSQFVVLPYVDATQSGVVMSAYAFDKPCIATNVGGLPEMVVDEEYGMIVPPRDANKLAEAIIELNNNNEKLDRFSRNIRNAYRNGDKSWLSAVNGLKRIYEQIMQK